MRSRAAPQSPVAWWRQRNKSTAAEVAALVSPSNLNVPAYERSRYASWEDWAAACDEAGAIGRLDADYEITADIKLPKKCDFAGFKIVGAFYTDHEGHSLQPGFVLNWVAKQPRIRGCFMSRYTGINTGLDDTGFVTVDGGGDGTAWCDIGIEYTRRIEYNNDNGYVNFNRQHGGIARYVHFTGSSPGVDMHANEIIMPDVSKIDVGDDWGIFQDDATRQVNIIRGVYYEGGANIRGNFHIDGAHGDASSPPHVDRFRHIMNSIGVNQLNRSDFLSLSVRNLVRGGCWDWLGASGVPVGFGNSGGASVSVQTDGTEPCGMGRTYQAQFADAFDAFTVTLQPSGVDRATVVIFYKSADDFEHVESNDGTGTVGHNPEPVTVDAVNNWKLLRLAVPTNKTATTTINLFGYGGSGGAAKVMALGGVMAVAGNGGVPPYKNDEYFSQLFATGQLVAVGAVEMQSGNTGELGYTASNPKEVAIAFHRSFDSTTGLSVSCFIEATGGPSANFSKVYVKSGTLTAAGFTAVIQFASDFQGVLHWKAEGRRDV